MSSLGVDGAPRVAVVGGGLAGLAASVALASAGFRVELFEARRYLGGRAASFRDPQTDQWIDHCQHVSMGCCTNMADFCRRTGIAHCFRRHEVLYFVGPDGRQYPLVASRWLPAPLHLAPGFWGLKYLSWRDRLRIARAVWRLMRTSSSAAERATTVGQWLQEQRQSSAAIDAFWKVILVSALGEDLDRASLAAARKVIVDGFLAAREAYTVEIPIAPLSALYGQHLEQWFAEHGVVLHMNSAIRQVSCDVRPLVSCADGRDVRPDYVVIALPWSKIVDVVAESVARRLSWLEAMSPLEGAPITAVHLWFDRPIMTLPHAVIVGRLSQWIFNRGAPGMMDAETDRVDGHYYQVVISASRVLAGRDRQAVIAEVCAELAEVWPDAASARLLNARVVTQSEAVFSPAPEIDALRPAQQTAIAGLVMAGDWTDTGWPATMESAVRSGYLAAEAICLANGKPRRFLVPDLARGPLSRWLIK